MKVINTLFGFRSHCEWYCCHHDLTLTKLVIEALRNLTAILTTAASFERASCLNKAPHVAMVEDFKNCSEIKRSRFLYTLFTQMKFYFKKGPIFFLRYLTWLECVVKAKRASMYLLRFAGTSTSTSEPWGEKMRNCYPSSILKRISKVLKNGQTYH